MAGEENPHLLAAIEAIYGASLEPELWSDAIDHIRRATDADSAFMITVDVMPEQGGILALSNLDRDAFMPQLQQVLVDNPFIRAWENLGAPSGRLFRVWDLIDREALEKWEGLTKWARPQNFHYVITTMIYERQPFVTPKYNLNVLRQPDSPEFTEKQMHLMRVLMTHVQRGLLVHWRLSSQEQKFRAVQEVLDRLQIGVILLDVQGHIVLANSAAESLFRDGRVLKSQGQGVHAGMPHEDARFQKLIAEVTATATGRGISPGGTLKLHDDSAGADLLVLATPMRSDRGGTRWFGMNICAALFISEPKAKHPLSVQLLEQWFGFTPAEAQVAVDLMNGLDPEEISGRRHVSADTVRSQIKAIYEKTGVNRRGKLGKLLLTSPAAMVKVPG